MSEDCFLGQHSNCYSGLDWTATLANPSRKYLGDCDVLYFVFTSTLQISLTINNAINNAVMSAVIIRTRVVFLSMVRGWRSVVGRGGVVGWLRGGVVGGLGGVVGGFRGVVGLCLRVVGCAFICDLGLVAVDVVCRVVDVLGPSVRQGHRVGAGHGAVLV